MRLLDDERQLPAGAARQEAPHAFEGTVLPDRNAQFEHINAKADELLTKGQPVISVDTKKKDD